MTLGLAAPGDASERLQISCQIRRLLWRLDSCYAVSSSYTALPEECGVRLQCLIFPANGSLVFPANGSRELPVQGRRQGGLARARTSQPGVGCVSQETTLEAECSWYTEGLLVPKKPSTWAQVVMRLPQSTSKPAVSWQGFSSHPQSQPALSLLHQGVRKGLANRAFGISGLS